MQKIGRRTYRVSARDIRNGTYVFSGRGARRAAKIRAAIEAAAPPPNYKVGGGER